MAADLTQTFAGRHVEKVVLGVAVAILVGAIVWFVGLREPEDDLLGQVAGLVEQLKGRVDEEMTIEKVLTPEERVALGIGMEGTTVADLRQAVEGMPPPLKVAGPVVEPLWPPKETTDTDKELKHYRPEEVLPVEQVQAVAGFGVTDDQAENALATLEPQGSTTVYSDVIWAGCVGKFDLTRQWEIYARPYKEFMRKTGTEVQPPADPESPITVSKVELQRRELQPDGTWSPWQATPITATADVVPEPPDDTRDKRAVTRSWYPALRKNQAEVRRPPFYNILVVGGGQTTASLVGDVAKVAQPEPTLGRPPRARPKPAAAAEGEAAEPEAEAEPVEETAATSPWETPFAPDVEPSEEPTEVVGPAEREHVFATLWANDASVEPGKTYQYRMRVTIVNPVWSLPGVEDEKDRWTLWLVGDWSEPTEPVTIPRLMEFYFIGTSFGERVSLSLHKWLHGQWIIAPSVSKEIGARVVHVERNKRITVPGTDEKVVKDEVDLSPNVLLVDVLRGFQYQPEGKNRPISSNVLIYADERGNLGRRIDLADRSKEAADRSERRRALGGTPRASR